MLWNTKITYVDIETGEELIKRQIESGHYVKVKKDEKTVVKNKEFGTKFITWRCERNRQTTLGI